MECKNCGSIYEIAPVKSHKENIEAIKCEVCDEVLLIPEIAIHWTVKLIEKFEKPKFNENLISDKSSSS